jgi:hypothetical protein
MFEMTDEGQERVLKHRTQMNSLNLYELNVLARHKDRPYLRPLLRERDQVLHLVYVLKGRLTLEQWMLKSLHHYKELLVLLSEVIQIVEAADRLCLRPEKCSLEPGHIFYHIEHHRLELVYLPTREPSKPFVQQWRHLLEKLDQRAMLCLEPDGRHVFEGVLRLTQSSNDHDETFLSQIRQSIQKALEMPDPADDILSETPAVFRGYSTQEQRSLRMNQPNSNLTRMGHVASWIQKWMTCLPNIKNTECTHGPEKTFHKDKAGSEEAKYATYTPLTDYGDLVKPIAASEGTTLLTCQEQAQGRLTVQNNQTCKVFELSKPITRIGRNTLMCDVVIEQDITVGRLHAEIHNIDNAFYLKDLNSLNGTYVNGERLEPDMLFKLKSNDRFCLSELEILFV